MIEKIRKEELKKPDSFQVAAWRLIGYLTKNKRQVIAAAALLTVFITGTLAWFIYDGIYEKKAGELYFKAYEEDIKGTILGQEHAVKGYADLVSGYPRSRAALLSLFRLGSLYYSQNKYDEAIDSYRGFLAKKPNDKVFLYLAHAGLGYCFEAKSDLAKAAASFEEAQKYATGDNYTVLGYRNLARVYEGLNDKARSKEHLLRALELSKDHGLKLLIQKMISELGQS